MTAVMAIQADRVEKRFGRKTVLQELSLRVPAGSCYALLGRNGAGKTTLMRLLAGQLLPDAGCIRVLGEDPADCRLETAARIGYVAERRHLWREMTLPEYLQYQQAFFPERWDDALVSALCRRLRLPETGRIGDFSFGTAGKAALLGVLGRRPELLLLDDPLPGLDPAARREWQDVILESLAETGCTVFFSTHQIGELTGICDRAGILREGRMVAEGTIEELRARWREVRLPAAASPGTLPGEIRREVLADTLRVVTTAPEAELAAALQQQRIGGFRIQSLTLEEIFLELA